MLLILSSFLLQVINHRPQQLANPPNLPHLPGHKKPSQLILHLPLNLPQPHLIDTRQLASLISQP